MMKKLSLLLSFLLFSQLTLFATTPYNLEGINTIAMGIGEESVVSRASQVKNFVLTYSYDEMIETENVEADVYDLVMNYLTEEFLEQFHEDNEA